LDWEAEARRRIVWERGSYNRRADVRKGDEYLSAASAGKLYNERSEANYVPALEVRHADVPRPEGWSADSFTLTIEIEAKRFIRLIYSFTSVAPGYKETILEEANRLLTKNAQRFFMKFQAFLLRDYHLHGGEWRDTPAEIFYSIELQPRMKRKHRRHGGGRPAGPSR
jgi:hypothetical protein